MRWVEPKIGLVRDWYPWFAWYPVKVDKTTVWLEHVERKLFREFDKWEGEFYIAKYYRLPEDGQ